MLDCPCVPSSIPREGPARRQSLARSLLPSPRSDGLGPSAFRLLSHEAARFTLSHSARRFAPLPRRLTTPGGLSTLRSDSRDLSHCPEPATRRTGCLPRRDFHPLAQHSFAGRTTTRLYGGKKRGRGGRRVETRPGAWERRWSGRRLLETSRWLPEAWVAHRASHLRQGENQESCHARRLDISHWEQLP